MRIRLRLALAVVLTFLPPPSAVAIQLGWSTGTSDIEFSASVRCTLIVQASDLEGRVPRDFRLLWVTDTSGIVPVQLAGPDTCGLGLAQMATLSNPSGALELASNQLTATFCSLGSGLVYIARYVLDLPEGSKGTLKVVAIDPSDPAQERVVQSNEVRFNSGLSSPLPPVILRVEATHQGLEYEVRLIGAGLQGVTLVELFAPDESWELPLTITSISDTELRATASLAAWVPDCKILVRAADGRMATESVPGDPPPPPLDPQAGCQARFIEDIYPPAVIQPKDFAFVPGGWSPTGSWTFHLFYIRQNQLSKAGCPEGGCIEKNLGHAVSNDLETWTVLDTAAISVRPGQWDSQHVWAPTVIRHGVRYYMFYTGVDDAGDQRIIIATSTDLVNWEQGGPVIDAANAGSWVEPSPFEFSGSDQLRDPFVMEDPDHPGQWLMYFTAWTKDYPGMAAGFVRSRDVGFTDLVDESEGGKAKLERSEQNRASLLESPHVFQRSGKWWLFFTKPTSPQDTIYAFSTAGSPSNPAANNWSPIVNLRDLVPLNEATAYTFWHGTEHLRIAGAVGGSQKEYFAGFNDSDQSISYTQMQDVPSPLLFAGECPDALDVGGAAGGAADWGLRIIGAGASRSRLILEVTLREARRATVAIHDLFGRRIRTIATGPFASGRTLLEWSGEDEGSRPSASGVYFATLTTSQGRRSARVAFLK